MGDQSYQIIQEKSTLMDFKERFVLLHFGDVILY